MASEATQSFPGIFRSSEALMTRGLNPSDLEFQEHLPIAMNELKVAERHIGPYTSTGKVHQGIEIASRDNERVAKMIILPQKDVVVPGSASVLKQAQINAIPDSIRLTNPIEYERLTKGIMAQTEKDLTLGELNQVTISNNKILSPNYGKTAIDQLTADEKIANALKKGQTDASRKLMYEGVDTVGLGGGEELRKQKPDSGRGPSGLSAPDRQVQVPARRRGRLQLRPDRGTKPVDQCHHQHRRFDLRPRGHRRVRGTRQEGHGQSGSSGG